MRNNKTPRSTSSGTIPATGSSTDAAATTTGSGRSGEGSDSALAAMLRKRQAGVDNPPEPDSVKTSQQHDGKAARE